jgi:hypothetical protein
MLTDQPLEGGGYGRAFREDAMTRECVRMDAPTPEESKDQAHKMAAYRFEHGDHQPDGSVKPYWPYDKKPTQRPPWAGDKVLRPYQSAAAPPDAAAARQQQAMNTMGEAMVRQLGQLTAEDRKVFDRYGINEQGLRARQEEMLMINLTICMPRETAERLRKAQAEHPEWMQGMLKGLQQEAAYALHHTFGIDARVD